MSLVEKVRRTVRRYALIQRDARVVVALSGGADSVALVHLLRAMAEPDEFNLAGVAHFNHQLRAEESDRDQAFCRAFAAGLSLPFDVEKADVRRLAEEQHVSVEHAGHDARLAFFERAAKRLNADAVAVAHTKDDQAETFLLRLLRGAGPRGLGGMHPRSGIVIRPFIETRRDDVRQFLREQQLSFREDSSNQDLAIPRNRVRHELIPLLESRFSAGIVDVLDREAAIARDDGTYLDAIAAEVAARLVAMRDEEVTIDIQGLLAQAAGIARRVVRQAQILVSEGVAGGFDAADAVLGFAVSKSSAGSLDFPGHRVNRRGDSLVLTKRPGRRAAAESAERPFRYDLEVPGAVMVPEAECTISADVSTVNTEASSEWRSRLTSRGDQVLVDAGLVQSALVVRSRQPGDTFRPLGLGGHKKVHDLFIDAKVARAVRDRIPLIVDATGRIVWVAGLAVAEDFRVTDRTRAVVILKRVPHGAAADVRMITADK